MKKSKQPKPAADPASGVTEGDLIAARDWAIDAAMLIDKIHKVAKATVTSRDPGPAAALLLKRGLVPLVDSTPREDTGLPKIYDLDDSKPSDKLMEFIDEASFAYHGLEKISVDGQEFVSWHRLVRDSFDWVYLGIKTIFWGPNPPAWVDTRLPIDVEQIPAADFKSGLACILTLSVGDPTAKLQTECAMSKDYLRKSNAEKEKQLIESGTTKTPARAESPEREKATATGHLVLNGAEKGRQRRDQVAKGLHPRLVELWETERQRNPRLSRTEACRKVAEKEISGEHRNYKTVERAVKAAGKWDTKIRD